MPRSPDPHGPTVAVLAHGAGSTADFVARAFEPADLGVDEVLAVDHRCGDVHRVAAELAATVHRARHDGARVAVVGGVSLGAHAAVTWARHGDPRDAVLLLALPAWSGTKDPAAALTRASASDVAQRGPGAVLADLQAQAPHDWVVAELAAAWPTYDPADLAAALRAAGSGPGPTPADLAALTVPAVVLALADDPLHPETLARTWARTIPQARFTSVGRHAPATDRAVLGRTAGAALAALAAAATPRAAPLGAEAGRPGAVFSGPR